MTKHKSPNKAHWSTLRDESALKAISSRMKKVKALTPGQQVYLDALNRGKVVICSGPAGSGKSWMACGKAVEALKTGRVKKIILTRPLQTCDEQKGFEPGDNNEKMRTPLAPLLDAIDEFLDKGELENLIETGVVKLVALGDMRGSTVKDSFIIADEAQNGDRVPSINIINGT